MRWASACEPRSSWRRTMDQQQLLRMPCENRTPRGKKQRHPITCLDATLQHVMALQSSRTAEARAKGAEAAAREVRVPNV